MVGLHRKVAGLLAFGAALVVSASASASHYMLADVPDVVPAQHHATLLKAGIENTAQLYERAVTKAARQSLSSATGIDVQTLGHWARFLDIMQLAGPGPKMVRVLNAAGVDTLVAFQKADAVSLVQRMRQANAGNKYSEVLPSSDVVGAWIDAARKVKPRLE
ncbi:MAG: DUF4332 domain-containing protein [Myxococcales bacterium]|nr:DUF4332 domain-containing protein [Myxococcales bacterium]